MDMFGLCAIYSNLYEFIRARHSYSLEVFVLYLHSTTETIYHPVSKRGPISCYVFVEKLLVCGFMLVRMIIACKKHKPFRTLRAVCDRDGEIHIELAATQTRPVMYSPASHVEFAFAFRTYCQLCIYLGGSVTACLNWCACLVHVLGRLRLADRVLQVCENPISNHSTVKSS